MRLTIIAVCCIGILYYLHLHFTQPQTITPVEKGANGKPLKSTYTLTYMAPGTFECPAYRTYEKIGVKVHIMPPDTIKLNPLMLSDWKVRIDSADSRKKYRSGEFNLLPKEVQNLFWFKPE